MPKVNDVGITIKPGIDNGTPISSGGAADAVRAINRNAPQTPRPDASTLNATSRAMKSADIAGDVDRLNRGR